MFNKMILRGIKSINNQLINRTTRNFAESNAHMYGRPTLPFTNKIDVYDHTKFPKIPIYRVLDHEGHITGDINTSNEIILNLYKNMLRVRIMDDFLLKSQRQGTISFYMSSIGEESIVGTVAACDNNDIIFAQYREQVALHYRGFTYQEFIDQCSGLYTDEGKGRQMPIHYTSSKHNFVTISSPLGTQITHAAGTAYHQKMTGSKYISLCYFGDGTSSESDFHSGLNIASTLKCPVFYIARNNGYAISTHISQQFVVDGVSDRAHSYNIPTIRVDGNDVIAVYQASKVAREYVGRTKEPFLLELMTNRLGDHSTSDDSSAYRSKDIVNGQGKYDGLARAKNYLISKKVWSEEEEKKVREDSFNELIKCVDVALSAKPYPIDTLYDDVFSTYTEHQKLRKAYLDEHISRHKDYYDAKH